MNAPLATKTYLHTIPGSRYVDKLGNDHYFLGGQFTTSDPEIIADLDKQIANKNSMLRGGKLATPDPAVIRAATEITKAAEAAARLEAAKVSGRPVHVVHAPAPT